MRRGLCAGHAVDPGILLVDVVRGDADIVRRAAPGEVRRPAVVRRAAQSHRAGRRLVVGGGRGGCGDGCGGARRGEVPGGVTGPDGEGVRGRGGQPVDVGHHPGRRDGFDLLALAVDLVAGDRLVVGGPLPHDVRGRGAAGPRRHVSRGRGLSGVGLGGGIAGGERGEEQGGSGAGQRGGCVGALHGRAFHPAAMVQTWTAWREGRRQRGGAERSAMCRCTQMVVGR